MSSLLYPLEVFRERPSQIDVSGERVHFLAVDEHLHRGDGRQVRGQRRPRSCRSSAVRRAIRRRAPPPTSRLRSTYASPLSVTNSARSVVPGGIAETSGSATGAICASTICRAWSTVRLAERHVALDAGQMRPVGAHVEEVRLDLASAAPPRRPPRPVAGRRRARGRRAVPRGSVTNSSHAIAIATSDQRRRRPTRGRASSWRRPESCRGTSGSRRRSPAPARSGSRRRPAASPDPRWSGSPARRARPACSPTRGRASARGRPAGGRAPRGPSSCPAACARGRRTGRPSGSAPRPTRTKSISREPPPKVGRRSAAAGVLRRLHGGRVERGVEDLRAGGRGPARRVRVQAEEEIGLVVVRERGAVVERHDAIVVSREEHAHAEPRSRRATSAGARPRASRPFPSCRPRPSRPRRRRRGRDRSRSCGAPASAGRAAAAPARVAGGCAGAAGGAGLTARAVCAGGCAGVAGVAAGVETKSTIVRDVASVVCGRGAERGEARAELDRDRRSDRRRGPPARAPAAGRCGSDDVERVGVEPDRSAARSAATPCVAARGVASIVRRGDGPSVS